MMATIAVSDCVREHILSVYGADPAKVVRIHRGADVDRFRPDAVEPGRAAEFRARLGVAPGAALEDIASAKGMDLDELVTEIEGIVSTGTKLNLDYYIEDNYDEEDVEEIYEYFRSKAESDSVGEAIAALGGDFEELEIRLIRIKFLCDIAS